MSARSVLGLVAACLAASAVSATEIDEFWGWFAHAEQGLRQPEWSTDDREAMEYWLGRIEPDLSHERSESGRKQVLVFSSDGNPGLFRTVERLVSESPRIRGWKFLALRRQQKSLQPVTVGSVELDPADVFFDLYRDGARIGVVFYLEDYAPDQIETYRTAARRLMCQAIGERNVGVEVGFVDIDRQTVRDMQFSRPLSDFKEAFDQVQK